MAPGGGMTSTAHTEDDIALTAEALDKTIGWMQADGVITA